MLIRLLMSTALLLASLGFAGCATFGSRAAGPQSNPIYVAANPQVADEIIWERTIDVLHDYRFEIAREDQNDRLIETRYKVGSGVLEPFQRDSVGWTNRWESTLQSVRRRVFISLTPAEGGYLVGVEAYRELEDVTGVAANSLGGATFREAQPLSRDLNEVVGESAPSRWIPAGRDYELEQDMLARLRTMYAQ